MSLRERSSVGKEVLGEGGFFSMEKDPSQKLHPREKQKSKL